MTLLPVLLLVSKPVPTLSCLDQTQLSRLIFRVHSAERLRNTDTAVVRSKVIELDMKGEEMVAIITSLFIFCLFIFITVQENRQQQRGRKMATERQLPSTRKKDGRGIGALREILAEMDESEIIDAMGAVFEQLKTQRREGHKPKGRNGTMVRRELDTDNAEWEWLPSEVEREA